MPVRRRITLAVTPHMDEVLQRLSVRMDASVAEVVRASVSLMSFLTEEIDNDNHLLIQRQGKQVEVVIPSLLEQVEPTDIEGAAIDPLDPIEWRGRVQ